MMSFGKAYAGGLAAFVLGLAVLFLALAHLVGGGA
jgi:hypothetical protein